MKFGEANWTQERLDIVRRMDAEGHSRREISIVLGVTRNAVCGKLARMTDRPHRVSDQRTDRERLRKQRQRQEKKASGLVRVGDKWVPKALAPLRIRKKQSPRGWAAKLKGVPPKPKLIALPAVEPTSATNVTMLDLPYSGACKFPVGQATGAAQLFCGSATDDDQHVYCRFHCLKAYRQPNEPVKRRQPVSTYRKFGEAA